MGRRSKSSNRSLDRISELPIEIRLRILSLATTKSAVRVGAVSKKWAGLWASSPNLIFDQSEFQIAGRDDFPPSSTARFVSFVDRALALRHKSVGIGRFELRWFNGFQIEKATPWLEYAVTGNTREMLLVMSSSPWQVFVFPPSLLCSPSLEHWDLIISDGFKDARGLYRCTRTIARLGLPDAMSLRSLKYLRFGFILVPAQAFGLLISNCPFLEYLSVNVSDRGVVKASAPNLRDLVIRCAITDLDSRIQITTPKLEQFHYRFGPSLFEINLGDTRLLESGCISCSMNQCEDGAKLARILANFCNVKTLVLERCSVESLAVLDSSQRLSLPFPHLKCLTLEVLLNDNNIRIIIILLNWFSNLQKLVIYNYERYDFRSNVNVLEDDRSPHKVDFDCGLNHLKEIEIKGFLGVKDELEFVKLLLQNASTLRTMLLNYKKELRNHETWMEISQSLSIVSRASLNAEIQLSPLLNLMKIEELAGDDSKNNEFSTWLKEDKGIFSSDLSFEAVKDLFSRFVKARNSRKLESQYYKGRPISGTSNVERRLQGYCRHQKIICHLEGSPYFDGFV